MYLNFESVKVPPLPNRLSDKEVRDVRTAESWTVSQAGQRLRFFDY